MGGVAIAAAKSCDINVQCEEIETATTSGAWRTALTGRKSWSVSTNQLVTSLVRPMQMVGTSTTIIVCIEGEYGNAFNYVVDNPELESGTLDEASYMVWDKTRKKFLAVEHNRPRPAKFYEDYSFEGSSAYSSPQDSDMFYSNNGLSINPNSVYSFYNGDLHTEKLTGNANVVNCRVVGTVGNLAQCSFQCNGNGALTPSSLPST